MTTLLYSVYPSIIDLSNLDRDLFWNEVARLNADDSLDYIKYINAYVQVIYGCEMRVFRNLA